MSPHAAQCGSGDPNPNLFANHFRGTKTADMTSCVPPRFLAPALIERGSLPGGAA
jgi:hypothetical protein